MTILRLRIADWLWGLVLDLAGWVLRPSDVETYSWRWRWYMALGGQSSAAWFALDHALNPPELLEYDPGRRCHVRRDTGERWEWRR